MFRRDALAGLLAGQLETLDDFVAFERLVYGDAYVDSFVSPKRELPRVRHKRFAVPRGKTGRTINACWEIEDAISARLKELAPGVFAGWQSRDWQGAILIAPTPWLKGLVRRGAAVRVRRLELSEHGHDFKLARDAYRDISYPEEDSTAVDAEQSAAVIRDLLTIIDQTQHPPGRPRPDSCAGPPRSKRLTRTARRARRAGHGPSFSPVGSPFKVTRLSAVA